MASPTAAQQTDTINYAEVQIKGLCFTISGHAYEHGIKDRELNAQITTYPVSSIRYVDRLASMARAGAFITRPSITATAEELAELSPPSSMKCLIIGLALDNIDIPFGKVAEGLTRGHPVGVKKSMTTIATRITPAPYRVVVKITAEEPVGGTKFYALISTKDGLSFPFLIAQREVFYFSEFRDATRTTEGRKTAWNRLVRAQAVRHSTINSIVGKKRKTAIKQLGEVNTNKKNEGSLWYITAAAILAASGSGVAAAEDLDLPNKDSMDNTESSLTAFNEGSIDEQHEGSLNRLNRGELDELDEGFLPELNKSFQSPLPGTLTEFSEDPMNEPTEEVSSEPTEGHLLELNTESLTPLLGNSVVELPIVFPVALDEDSNTEITENSLPQLNIEPLASLLARSAAGFDSDDSKSDTLDGLASELTENSESGMDY